MSESEFELRLDFQRETRDPARVFYGMGGCFSRSLAFFRGEKIEVAFQCLENGDAESEFVV